MKKRKSQGFTVLQTVALDPECDLEMRSPSGEKALLNDNPDTPNERCFEYLDWILDKAEEYGFYVLRKQYLSGRKEKKACSYMISWEQASFIIQDIFNTKSNRLY